MESSGSDNSNKADSCKSDNNASFDTNLEDLILDTSKIILESESQRPSSSVKPAVPEPLIEAQEHISTISQDLLPVNWPKHVKYLVDYEYHPSISPSLLDLVQGRRRKWKELGVSIKSEEVEEEDEPRSEIELEYDDIPIGNAIPGILRSVPSIPPITSTTGIASSTVTTSNTQEPPFEIRLIDSPPSHPVLGSYGLFATQTLRPGRHLLDYISLIVPDEHADPQSDHTLYLCNDLNLDASLHGNHGRFVNDFRNIRSQEQGPNVAWDLYRDASTGQVRMGCKVLKRIRPGEEILCTYGKAYWKSRGVKTEGEEWEDGWDTDYEDQSDTGE
ncbi:hypothetical protein BGZ80_005236 [Entomortierella chlamydospora]|uniref:SET domain-containing protein n=1 Tax=Entomortierella chlamydospora TaxID=101097 RepID=A0A9P6N4D9_9FUNG|nr:hypothetical protein BGZ79_002608 [Entomortierella chlamydospora]KAG0024198.1 hypothetical protein BGZ80_005236 [Entomortierella chlamydospora]